MFQFVKFRGGGEMFVIWRKRENIEFRGCKKLKYEVNN